MARFEKPFDAGTFETMSDRQLRGLRAGHLIATEGRDPEWDAAFERRISRSSLHTNIMTALAEGRGDDARRAFENLPSDVEKIGTFALASKVRSGVKIEEDAGERARIKTIFITLGTAYNEAIARAKAGTEIRPVDLVVTAAEEDIVELRFERGNIDGIRDS